MKNISLMFLIVLLAFGCDKHIVAKPENLIEEDKMIDILYDMAVIDAMKIQNINNLAIAGVNENDYILKKYKIDSLQFANSNKYYASDIDNYYKMYEKIELRLNEEKNKTDTLVKKGIKLNTVRPVDTIGLKKGKKKKMAVSI
jgi:hypothetical protein